MKKSQRLKYLSYPQPIFVIGTYDKQKRPDIATVALAGMCSHHPPYFYVSLRAATYSHQNIMEREAFTVNVPSSRYLKETDYVGLVSGRDTDKFATCNLTAVPSEYVDAPLVQEFPTVAECQLRQTLDMGSHTMFIGEIMNVQGNISISTADLSYFSPDVIDIPDMIKAGGFVFAVTAEGRCYCSLGEPLGRGYSIGRSLIHS